MYMTNAIRDNNHVPVAMATSYVDGIALVPMTIGAVHGDLKTDEVHTIAFTPGSVARRDENHVHVMMGVSSVDGTPCPVYADPVTGGILTD
jgi:hypothetical protein